MNINFVFLSIFGILAGLTGHAASTLATDSTVPTTSDSTVSTATPAVSTDGGGSSATTDSATTASGPTDTSSPSVGNSGSSATTDSATTASGPTDTSSPSVDSSGSSSSSGSDSSSGTTAQSNTASDMSGTTMADSTSTAEADNCYSLTHSCSQTTNLSLCFDDFRSTSQSIDTCPRNGKYCLVKGTVKDNTTTLESGCVQTSCDHRDYTSDAEGHVILNCCSSSLCNDEKLLYAGSPSLRGVLPLVLLAAAAAVAVGGGASTAGTNIVV